MLSLSHGPCMVDVGQTQVDEIKSLAKCSILFESAWEVANKGKLIIMYSWWNIHSDKIESGGYM